MYSVTFQSDRLQGRRRLEAFIGFVTYTLVRKVVSLVRKVGSLVRKVVDSGRVLGACSKKWVATLRCTGRAWVPGL